MGFRWAGPHRINVLGQLLSVVSCIRLAWSWSDRLFSCLCKSICWASAVCPLATENLVVRARLKGYEKQTQKLNILATKKKRAQSFSESHRSMALWIMLVTVTPSEGEWLSRANNLTLRRARQSHVYPYTVHLSPDFCVCGHPFVTGCVCVCVCACVPRMISGAPPHPST